ncbi:MAG: GatB/YqeY domain-containing protein [Calditrichia bacterium]|nr:GatB/YqeY domain-containing protein [Calditrichia bacterium]
MSIQSKLLEDMKAALKSGDKIRLETIRGLRSELKNSEIKKGDALSPDDEIQVLMTASKRRKESIEQFKAGQRFDRAEEEQKELDIIQEYLPQQMTEQEITLLVDAVITESSASSGSDMGKVMGKIMPQVKGRADGKMIQKIVQQKLATL